MTKLTRPTPAEVKALREEYAEQRGLGITAAQQACADMALVSLRNWQQWETGERKRVNMASWKLVLLETGKITL